eukprot:7331597-Pyramimonas_sp.AAC.1
MAEAPLDQPSATRISFWTSLAAACRILVKYLYSSGGSWCCMGTIARYPSTISLKRGRWTTARGMAAGVSGRRRAGVRRSSATATME